jgi:hypothetical protein
MSSAEEIKILKDHPAAEDYRMLIENAWKDLHHSRLQEWSSLGVVTGFHLVAIQIVRSSEELKILISGQYLSATAFVIGILFALIGAAITCRHRKIMGTKMNWIWDAEKKLGLMWTKQNIWGIIDPKDVNIQLANHKRRFIRPKFGSVSNFILMFYVIFVIVDITIIADLLL